MVKRTHKMYTLVVFCLVSVAVALPVTDNLHTNLPDVPAPPELPSQHIDEHIEQIPLRPPLQDPVPQDSEHTHIAGSADIITPIQNDKLSKESAEVQKINNSKEVKDSKESKERQELKEPIVQEDPEEIINSKESKESQEAKEPRHSEESKDSKELNKPELSKESAELNKDKDGEADHEPEEPVLVEFHEAKKPSLLAWIESFFSRPIFSFRPFGRERSGLEEQPYYVVEVEPDDVDE